MPGNRLLPWLRRFVEPVVGRRQVSCLPDTRKAPKVDETANNEVPAAADESGDPHKMMNPHGSHEPAWRHADARGGGDAEMENTGKLDIETVHFTVPKAWIRKAPKMPNIIQAEYAIPKAEGDKEDGRLTVSHGSAATWKTTSTAGKGSSARSRTRKTRKPSTPVGSRSCSLISRARSGLARHDDAGPAVSRPDYRMLGAIFQVPGDDATALRQVLRAEEDDHRPCRRNQGIPPARSRWISNHGLRGLHDSRLRSQSADVLLRDDHGLRPGLQALPGLRAGESRSRATQHGTKQAAPVADRPVPQAADGRAHRRRSAEAARPDGTDRPRPQRRPGNGPHALRHAAGHARGLCARSARRASSGWASASTVPTPRSTTTSAAGKAASIGPARCSWPPANWAWPCRSTRRFAGGTWTCWTRWPSSSRPSASPCGPCSSSCRWAAASRRSGSSPKSTSWSSKSSTTGRRPSLMP